MLQDEFTHCGTSFFSKKRTVELYKDYLVVYKPGKRKSKRVIKLNFVKCDWVAEEKNKFVFRFQKGGDEWSC